MKLFVAASPVDLDLSAQILGAYLAGGYIAVRRPTSNGTFRFGTLLLALGSTPSFHGPFAVFYSTSGNVGRLAVA